MGNRETQRGAPILVADGRPSLVGGSSSGNYESPVRSYPAANFCRRVSLYCSSLVTSCCMLLAWASAEIPVWLRISYLDMFEVAAA
jgi:hypothetical protein